MAPLFIETRMFFVPLDLFLCLCRSGCLHSVVLTSMGGGVKFPSTEPAGDAWGLPLGLAGISQPALVQSNTNSSSPKLW